MDFKFNTSIGVTVDNKGIINDVKVLHFNRTIEDADESLFRRWYQCKGRTEGTDGEMSRYQQHKELKQQQNVESILVCGENWEW